MDLREVFGADLRRLRHAKGLSQDELAYEAEVSRSYLSQVEKGAFFYEFEDHRVLSAGSECRTCRTPGGATEVGWTNKLTKCGVHPMKGDPELRDSSRTENDVRTKAAPLQPTVQAFGSGSD
jgi:hypothetical protein